MGPLVLNSGELPCLTFLAFVADILQPHPLLISWSCDLCAPYALDFPQDASGLAT